MSDLVGNPEDRFSRVEAQLCIYYIGTGVPLYILVSSIYSSKAHAYEYQCSGTMKAKH